MSLRPYTDVAIGTGHFNYLRNLPDPTPYFVVTNIPVLVTQDPSRGTYGVVRDAYVEVQNGRIVGVGIMQEMPNRLRSDREHGRITEVSGKNRIVTPGLMHGHTHLCQTLWKGQGEGKQLLQWLRDHTWPGEAALDPVDIAMAAHLGAAEALCHGATTCLDMGTVHHTNSYVRHGILPTGLRVWTGNVVMDHMDPAVPFPRHLHEAPEVALRKTLETMQQLSDLSEITDRRINPAVTMRFLLTSEEETARALAEMAREHGWVLQTHAAESPGEIAAIRERFGTDNIQKLHELGFLGPQTFLHHCVHATPDEIALMTMPEGMEGLGMAQELGRVAVGYRADLVFWNQLDWPNFVDLDEDRDVIGRLVRTHGAAQEVYVDGQQVVADGQPLFIVDRALFRRMLNDRVRALNERAKRLRVPIPGLEA